MKKTVTKALSLLLTGATVLSMASCAGGSQKDLEAKRAAKLMKLSNVYTMRYLTDGSEGDQTNFDGESLRFVGDDMYATGYYRNEDKDAEGGSRYTSGRHLYKISADGQSEIVRSFENSDVTDEETQTSDWINVSAIMPAADGTFWYSRAIGHSDWSDPDNCVYNSYYEVVHEDADGNELMCLNTKDLLAEKQTEEDGNFYVSSIVETADGDILLVSYDGYAAITHDGTLVKYAPKLIEDDDSYVNASALTPDGEILVLIEKWGEDGRTAELKRLNYEKGEYEFLCDCSDFIDLYQFYAGDGTTIYYITNLGISSLDYSTGETKEVLNYINSDINSNRVNIVAYLGDGKFLCTEYDSSYENRRMAVMEPVSDGDIVEKYVLDFAAVYLSSELQDAIIDFNKQNAEYRIRFIDYSQYNTDNDWKAGITKLNNDIISGNIPDMFSLEELPLENYISKSLIADLKTFMDSDEDFNEEEFMQNILHATEQNGKIYSLIVSYSINCLISANDYFDGKTSVSMKEFYELRKKMPDSQLFMPYCNRSDLLTGYNGGNIVTNAFLKANDGKGAFDSEDYAMWLELVKEYPEEYNWEAYENLVGENGNEYELYKSGKVLFSTQYLSTFSQKYIKRSYGDNYTFIGLPVPENSGSGVAINPIMEIAVSAKSAFQPEAWNFIKYLMGEDFQKNANSFSIRKDVLQQRIDEALAEKPSAEYGDDDFMVDYASSNIAVAVTEDVAIDGAVDVGDNTTKGGLRITQEDVDKIYAMIELADTVIRSNEEINKIIEEEAGAYFSGKKTAAEVGSLIQSRVSLYVSEDQ